MFGLIGHSTSFEDAKRKASLLGFDHIADGDLDVWCTAPPQLVENVEVKSATGISIEGSYIDSCFVPEMLSRFKTASMPKTMEIDANNLKQPCLMIDGGYPKNLDEKFQGNNIHVVKGGIVRFFNDIGWNMMELAEMQNPQREMFACFAEAMILEFEKCHTNFSWGRNNISLEKMEFIGAASVKHGFSAIGLDKHPKVLAV